MEVEQFEQTPLWSASLVSVPYIILPKTRPKDVVSIHECYTYFLLMLSEGKENVAENQD